METRQPAPTQQYPAVQSKEFRLSEITEILEGELHGDPETMIRGCGTLNSSIDGEITFLASARHSDELAKSNASAVIVPRNYQPPIEIAYIQVDEPEKRFVQLVNLMRPPVQRPRIGASSKAYISASAKIAEDVSIYPGAYIGDEVEIESGTTIYPNVCILERSRIGSNVNIFPNATLYPDTIVGNDTTIHAGVVLGAHGFGYESDQEGHHIKHQLGFVEVHNDVELGANSCVDRGAFGATRIGTGTRFDNMVQIGHNVQIGEHNMICAQVGIAGSCTTGSFVVMGGQAGIGDHVDISDRVRLGAKTGVMADIEAGQTMIGIPALPARKTMQVWAVQARLPELRSTMNQLNRKLETVEKDIQKRNESIEQKLDQIRNEAA